MNHVVSTLVPNKYAFIATMQAYVPLRFREPSGWLDVVWLVLDVLGKTQAVFGECIVYLVTVGGKSPFLHASGCIGIAVCCTPGTRTRRKARTKSLQVQTFLT